LEKSSADRKVFFQSFNAQDRGRYDYLPGSCVHVIYSWFPEQRHWCAEVMEQWALKYCKSQKKQIPNNK
jgi:hypothetical protein